MILLVVSDTHNRYSEKDFRDIDDYCKNHNIEIKRIISLGDITDFEYKLLKKDFNVPIYGVIGNHDWPTVLEINDIPNLHGNLLTFENGLSATGFCGSSKYKATNEPNMFTQSRSVEIARQLPVANILFSHDTACHDETLLSSNSSYSHAGLWGITRYLEHTPSCKLHIHGHLHQSFHNMIDGLTTICVFRWALIDVSDSLQVTYLYDFNLANNINS